MRLIRRDQERGPHSAITERFIRITKVHADVQPSYPSTHYLSAQVDTPVTHMIRLRWQDYLELVTVITRSTRRPNDDSWRCELFRIRRTKETGGRKRFVELEVELERVHTIAEDTDAEIEALFAENPVIH